MSKVRSLLRAVALAGPTCLFLLGGFIGRSQAYPGAVFVSPAPVSGPAVSKTTTVPSGSWTVSSSTGAAEFSIPISVPPGRLGMEPSLALVYSSQNPIRGSAVGAGWTLPVPMIRLDTSMGRLGEPRFVSTLSGSQRLIEIDEPGAAAGVRTFRADGDSSYVRYEHVPDGTVGFWRARTADGRVYTFGDHWQSRDEVDGAGEGFAPRDHAVSNFVGARWFVTRVEDQYGNYIKYRYGKIAGAAFNGRLGLGDEITGSNVYYVDIALSAIEYTANDEAGVTAHAWISFPRHLYLEVCEGSDVPIGARFDYSSGRRIYEGAKRMTGIKVYVRKDGPPEDQWELRRQYDLQYAIDEFGTFSHRPEYPIGREVYACDESHGPLRLLTSVTETGYTSDGTPTTLPPISFEYGRLSRDLSATKSVAALADQNLLDHGVGEGLRRLNKNKAGGFPTIETMIVDADGDGRPDVLRSNDNLSSPTCDTDFRPIEPLDAVDGMPMNMSLPTMPWADGSFRNTTGNSHQIEECSLAAQVSRRSTPVPSMWRCGIPTNYLVYRLFDIDGDGYNDLVTQIGHQKGAYRPADDATLMSMMSYPAAEDVEPCVNMDGPTECLLAIDMSTVYAAPPGMSDPDEPCTDGDPITGDCGSRTDETTTSCPSGECMIGGSEGTICHGDPSWCCSASHCRGGHADYIGSMYDPPEMASDGGWAWAGPTPLTAQEEKSGGGAGGFLMNANCGHRPERYDRNYVWRVWRGRANGTFEAPELKLSPVPLETERAVSQLGAGDMASASSWHGLTDMDGDGCVDAVWQHPTYMDTTWSGDFQVFRGDCTGDFSDGPYIWNVPDVPDRARVNFNKIGLTDRATWLRAHHYTESAMTLQDINGDGLPDYVVSVPMTTEEEGDADTHRHGSTAPLRVYYNTGTGFEDAPSDQATVLSDEFSTIEREVSVPLSWREDNYETIIGWSQATRRFFDFDQDGLGDVLVMSAPGEDQINPWAVAPGGTTRVYHNVGDRFVLASNVSQMGQWRHGLSRITVTDKYRWQVKTDAVDLDGDGLFEIYNNQLDTTSCNPDWLKVRDEDPTPWSWEFCGLSSQVTTDTPSSTGLRVLKRIDNGRGGSITFGYKPAALSVRPRGSGEMKVPGGLWLVDSVTVDDGTPTTDAVTDYEYAGPVYNQDRDGRWGFRGFEQVAITHPETLTDSGARRGQTIERYDFITHYSGYLAERVSLVEAVADPFAGAADRNPYTIEAMSYAPFSLFDGAVITVHPTETRTWTCDTTAPLNTEQSCRASGQLRRKVTGWTPLFVAADPVLDQSGGSDSLFNITVQRAVGNVVGGGTHVNLVENDTFAPTSATDAPPTTGTQVEGVRVPLTAGEDVTTRGDFETIAPPSGFTWPFEPLPTTAPATPALSANRYVCASSLTNSTPPSGSVTVMYVQCGVRLTPSIDAVATGDRRSTIAYELRWDDADYLLLSMEARKYEAVADGGSSSWGAMELVGRAATEYDDAGFATHEHVWHDEDSRSTTYRTRTLAGNLRTVQKPRQFDDGSTRASYLFYDEFQLYPIVTFNEYFQRTMQIFDLATGAPVFESEAFQGGGFPGIRHVYDGLGREVATYRVTLLSSGDEASPPKQVGETQYADPIGMGPTVITRAFQEYDDPTSAIVTTTAMDALARPLSVATTTSLGPSTTSYQRDASGNLTSLTVPSAAPSGGTVTYAYRYDTAGRPTLLTGPAIAPIETIYAGMTTIRTQLPTDDGIGQEVRTTNDMYGRLVEVVEVTDLFEQPEAVTEYAYDANDNMEFIRDADGLVTEMEHDFAGHRVAIHHGGRTWRYDYDLNGNMVAEIPPLPDGVESCGTFGCFPPFDWMTFYSYDDLDREVARVPGIRDLGPDSLDRYGIRRPDIGDGASAMERRSIFFDYDMAGVPYSVGRLSRVRLPFATIEYEYTEEGFVSREERALNVAPFPMMMGPINSTLAQTFDYDAQGKVIEVAHADLVTLPTTTTTTYDERGLPLAVSVNTGTGSMELARLTRNLAGVPTQRTSFGMTHQWFYDTLGRVDDHKIIRPQQPGQPIAGENLTWDSVGNVRSVAYYPSGTMGKTLTYTYDKQHQLATAVASDGTYSGNFEYSAAGRLLHVDIGSTIETTDVAPRNVRYGYEPVEVPDPANPGSTITIPGDRMTRLADADTLAPGADATVDGTEVANYDFDESGNVIYRYSGMAGIHFWYDGEDHLREASQLGPYFGEVYFYDHQGQRILAVAYDSMAGGSARQWFGATEIVHGQSGNPAERTVHVSLGAQPVAQIKNGNVTNPLLTFNGVLGSLLAVTDSWGAIREHYTYGPLGEFLSAQGLREQRRLYNGKEYDKLTRLGYYGYRYYDRFSLLWMEGDPLYRVVPDLAYHEPRRMVLYGFNLGNPLRYTDPDGKSPMPMVEMWKMKQRADDGNPWARAIFYGRSAADTYMRKIVAPAMVVGAVGIGSLLAGGVFGAAAVLDVFVPMSIPGIVFGAATMRNDKDGQAPLLRTEGALGGGEFQMTSLSASGVFRQGLRLVFGRPSQKHHYATNKSKRWTAPMEKIAAKYGLDLDGEWNKELLPHQGRHPDAYHDFVLRNMEQAAKEAGDDVDEFLRLYEEYVKKPVRENPDLLRKAGWE